MKKVILCGKYVNDLAMRFDCTEIPGEKTVCCDTVPQAVQLLEGDGDAALYVVTCFSDRDKLLNLAKREG